MMVYEITSKYKNDSASGVDEDALALSGWVVVWGALGSRDSFAALRNDEQKAGECNLNRNCNYNRNRRSLRCAAG